jgi:hypothetical protein
MLQYKDLAVSRELFSSRAVMPPPSSISRFFVNQGGGAAAAKPTERDFVARSTNSMHGGGLGDKDGLECHPAVVC